MRHMNFISCIRITRVAIAASFALLIAVPASADEFGLGIAGESAVVSVGPNASLTINSGPIKSTAPFGDVLVGQSSGPVSLSGGGNGALPDGLFTDGTVTISGNLQNSFNTFTVPTSVTASARGVCQ